MKPPRRRDAKLRDRVTRPWRLGALAVRALTVLAILTVAPPAQAAHYVSLRVGEANLREGPTYGHRILWVYRRRGYPFEVVATYDTWKRVRDSDGAVGWMSAAMLSDARTVLVTAKARATLHAKPEVGSAAVAFLEHGVVARLKACERDFCEVSAGGVTGWIDRHDIWGVDAGEVFE